MSSHDRIEAIAGAIALGEASDEERREYREHIAACAPCLHAFGGEREIERVAGTVACARDEEVWEPDLRGVVAAGMQRRSKRLRWGVSALGVAVAASFGVHLLLAAGIPHVTDPANAPVVINAGPTRIVLEQNPAIAKPALPTRIAPAQQPRLVVTHNVVQIARAPVSTALASAAVSSGTPAKPRDLVAITVHPQQAPPARKAHSSVPIWRRDDGTAWRTVARTTTTSVTETAPQTLTHSAESIQIANLPTRDVAPVGGETAINPQPPMIAYDEGAEGTTVFEVLVDERGAPTKCVITKSSGFASLDDAVCRAAMKARYTPKVVEGRAVPGAYHDAFTFHMSDQSSTIQQEIPQNAPGAHRMDQSMGNTGNG